MILGSQMSCGGPAWNAEAPAESQTGLVEGTMIFYGGSTGAYQIVVQMRMEFDRAFIRGD
jgi:hypothetical protein